MFQLGKYYAEVIMQFLRSYYTENDYRTSSNTNTAPYAKYDYGNSYNTNTAITRVVLVVLVDLVVLVVLVVPVVIALLLLEYFSSVVLSLRHLEVVGAYIYQS